MVNSVCEVSVCLGRGFLWINQQWVKIIQQAESKCVYRYVGMCVDAGISYGLPQLTLFHNIIESELLHNMLFYLSISSYLLAIKRLKMTGLC